MTASILTSFELNSNASIIDLYSLNSLGAIKITEQKKLQDRKISIQNTDLTHSVIFVWIPDHVDIQDNENADQIFKEATDSLTSLTLLHWSNHLDAKLQKIILNVQAWLYPNNIIRKGQTVIGRLRIELVLIYTFFKEILTVKDILTACEQFQRKR